jgi:hypothetical protein
MTVGEAISAMRILHEIDIRLFGESWTDAATRERRLQELPT